MGEGDPADEGPILNDKIQALLTGTPSERSDAIEQLVALQAVVVGELIDLIVASRLAGDHERDGAPNVVQWIALQFRVSHRMAKQLADASDALLELPAIRAAMAEGRITWDQLQPATRFATPDTDVDLAEDLPGMSVAQIEQRATAARVRTTADAKAAQRKLFLRFRADHDAGGFRLGGFLPADQASVVMAALTKRADDMGPDAETDTWAPESERMGRALVEQSEDDLQPAEGSQTIVVVHVDESTLTGDAEGNGEVDGVTVSAETARRMLCGCKIEFSVDGADGTTVGVGRAQRRQPAWLERRVRNRDGCCRFPGCNRRIRQIHHVKWWDRDEGPTDSDNLVGLCFHHHHLVHEGGWILGGNADREVTFTSQVGSVYRCRLQPLRPEVRSRVSAVVGVSLG